MLHLDGVTWVLRLSLPLLPHPCPPDPHLGPGEAEGPSCGGGGAEEPNSLVDGRCFESHEYGARLNEEHNELGMMQVACNGAIMPPSALSKGDGSGTPRRGQPRARARGRLCPQMKLTQQQIIISASSDLDHKRDPVGRLGGLGLGLERGGGVTSRTDCLITGTPCWLLTNALWVTQTPAPGDGFRGSTQGLLLLLLLDRTRRPASLP